MRRTVRAGIGRFLGDRGGATAVIFAIALLPIALAAGTAVDYSRLSDVRSALQRAVDAGALAAARAAREKRGDPTNVARATFAASFGRPEATLLAPVEHEVADGVHRVSARVELPMRIMSLAGQHAKTVAATAHATFGAAVAAPEPTEIVIVMDVTNSMTFGSRWNDAVKAVTGMLEAIKGDGSAEYFVTLVPMADRVNVSSVPGAATSWMRGQPPANWNGCLEPRERAIPGFPHALDDERPNANPDKFAPSAPGHFIANHVGATYGPNGVPACPRQAITGPTNDVKEIEAALAAFTPGGTGRYDEGLAWGWRALSERWQGQWKAGNSYPAKNGKRRKIAVLVTDGHTTAYDFEVGGSSGGSLGWNRGTRMGFEHLVALCNRMKADGIELHVVQTGGNTDYTAYARQCATSAQTHYRAGDVDAFAQAFRRIAGNAEVLRLVH